MAKKSYDVKDCEYSPVEHAADSSYKSFICAMLVFLGLCGLIALFAAVIPWKKPATDKPEEFLPENWTHRESEKLRQTTTTSKMIPQTSTQRKTPPTKFTQKTTTKTTLPQLKTTTPTRITTTMTTIKSTTYKTTLKYPAIIPEIPETTSTTPDTTSTTSEIIPKTTPETTQETTPRILQLPTLATIPPTTTPQWDILITSEKYNERTQEGPTERGFSEEEITEGGASQEETTEEGITEKDIKEKATFEEDTTDAGIPFEGKSEGGITDEETTEISEAITTKIEKAENEKPEEGTTKGGTTEREMTKGGISEEGLTDEGITESTTEAGITEKGIVEGAIGGEITERRITEDEIAEGGITERGITEEEVAEGGITERGITEEGPAEVGLLPFHTFPPYTTTERSYTEISTSDDQSSKEDLGVDNGHQRPNGKHDHSRRPHVKHDRTRRPQVIFNGFGSPKNKDDNHKGLGIHVGGGYGHAQHPQDKYGPNKDSGIYLNGFAQTQQPQGILDGFLIRKDKQDPHKGIYFGGGFGQTQRPQGILDGFQLPKSKQDRNKGNNLGGGFAQTQRPQGILDGLLNQVQQPQVLDRFPVQTQRPHGIHHGLQFPKHTQDRNKGIYLGGGFGQNQRPQGILDGFLIQTQRPQGILDGFLIQTQRPPILDRFLVQTQRPQGILDGFLIQTQRPPILDRFLVQTQRPQGILDGFLIQTQRPPILDRFLVQTQRPQGILDGFLIQTQRPPILDRFLVQTQRPQGILDGFLTQRPPILDRFLVQTQRPQGILDGFLIQTQRPPILDRFLVQTQRPHGIHHGLQFPKYTQDRNKGIYLGGGFGQTQRPQGILDGFLIQTQRPQGILDGFLLPKDKQHPNKDIYLGGGKDDDFKGLHGKDHPQFAPMPPSEEKTTPKEEETTAENGTKPEDTSSDKGTTEVKMDEEFASPTLTETELMVGEVSGEMYRTEKAFPSELYSRSSFFRSSTTELPSSRSIDLDTHKCENSFCKKIAGRMLNLMDHNADPCSDFFEFSCGNMPESINNDEEDTWQRFQKNMDERNPEETGDNPLQIFRNFYDSCLKYQENFDYAERVKGVLKILDSQKISMAAQDVGENVIDLTNLVAHMILTGSMPLLDVQLQINQHKQWDFLLTLQEKSSFLSADEQLSWSAIWDNQKRCLNSQRRNTHGKILDLDNLYDSYVECQHNHTLYLSSIANAVFQLGYFNDTIDLTENVKSTLQDVFGVMDDINATYIKNILVEKDVLKKNISELETNYGVLDWKKFFQILSGQDNVSRIRVQFDEYLKRFFGALGKLPKWRLNNALLSIYSLDLYNNLVLSKNSPDPERFCLKQTVDLFQDISSELYFKSIPSNSYPKFQSIAESIFRKLKDTLREQFANVAWLAGDDEHVMLEKLEDTPLVFYSHNEELKAIYPEVKEVENYPAAWIERRIAVKKQFYKLGGQEYKSRDIFNHFMKVYEKHPKTFFGISGIVVPLKPFFSSSAYNKPLPEYIEVVHLGQHLAKELGRKFDLVEIRHNVNLSKPTYAKLHTFKRERGDALLFSRSQKLKHQQLGFKIQIPVGVNGIISDGTALNILSNYTLAEIFDEEIMPWLSATYSKEKLFFIAIAQEYCRKVTPLEYMVEIYEGDHLPPSFRIQHMMGHSETFARVFECKMGALMTHEKPKHLFPQLQEDYEDTSYFYTDSDMDL